MKDIHTALIAGSVQRVINLLQLSLSNLELKRPTQALDAVKQSILEMRGLSVILSGVVTGHLEPGSVVVVPHGTIVVSSDDVTGVHSSDSVSVVNGTTVKRGHRNVNKRTA